MLMSYKDEALRTLATDYSAILERIENSPEEVAEYFRRIYLATMHLRKLTDDLKGYIFYGREPSPEKPYTMVEFSGKGLTESKLDALHAILGLISESGELAEPILRWVVGYEVNEDHIVEELGDIHWFMNLMTAALNLTESNIKKQNIAKLRARFPDKFSEADAIDRDVENEYKQMKLEEK